MMFLLICRWFQVDLVQSRPLCGLSRPYLAWRLDELVSEPNDTELSIDELIEPFEVRDLSRSFDVDIQSISHVFFGAKHAQVIDSSLFSMFKISPYISKVYIGLNVAI